MIQPRAARSFARQGMMRAIGAELLHADAGLCHVTAPILPDFTQQHGYGHAGITFALGDSAAGYAALTIMPEESEVLTAEMKINLLSPASGERLVAEGTRHPARSPPCGRQRRGPHPRRPDRGAAGNDDSSLTARSALNNSLVK